MLWVTSPAATAQRLKCNSQCVKQARHERANLVCPDHSKAAQDPVRGVAAIPTRKKCSREKVCDSEVNDATRECTLGLKPIGVERPKYSGNPNGKRGRL